MLYDIVFDKLLYLLFYYIGLYSRWIRLLFGREFYLPSVLQLWDALFAEGVSLALMDYIFVVMLMQIRDTCK